MPRSAKDVAKHAEDIAKHAEDGQGQRSSGTLLLRFKAYKVESGGIFIRCGTPRTLQSMPRSAKDVVKHAKNVAKHVEDGQERC